MPVGRRRAGPVVDFPLMGTSQPAHAGDQRERAWIGALPRSHI